LLNVKASFPQTRWSLVLAVIEEIVEAFVEGF
jgi:hypothetical protein